MSKELKQAGDLQVYFAETIPEMNRRIVARHTPHVKERLRIVEGRFEVNHFDVNLDDYEVSHYCLGNRMAKTKIKKAHFDSISVVAISECPINRTKHIHAIGTRTREKRSTLIVLSEIKSKQ